MRPIFVCGCPRSGTTLLGAMLGAHPRCVAVPESQFLPECEGALARGEVAPGPRAVYGWIRRHERFRLWGFDPDPAGLEAAAGDQALAEVMRWLAAEWGAIGGKTGCDVWVDHTPTHARWGETLRRLFPAARFLHLVRDGRGVTASLAPLDWGPGDPASAARWWARQLADGLALESALGEPVARVRYEDLVTEPEAVLRRICGHVELDYDAAMLAADGFRPPPNSRRQHARIGRPADPSRAGAWRSDLDRREIEIFESASGELLRYMGYEPLFGTRARPPGRAERLRLGVGAVLRRPAAAIRRRLRRRRR